MLVLAALSLLALLHASDGQCTIPSPLSNGRAFTLAKDNSWTLVLGTASTGVIELGGTNYTVACDGVNSGTSEYFGRISASTLFGTIHYGFCMQLRTASSSTVQGFSWRTNLTPIAVLGITGNLVGSPGSPTSHATACNAGGDRPEFEDDWIDISSGAFTPGNCPSALQNNFTYMVNPGSTCNNIADGITNPSQLRVTTTGCSQASTYFSAASTATLICMHGFTANGINYVTLRNTTGSPAEVHCMMYSVSGSTTTASLQLGGCDANQTTTVLGGASSGLLMVLTSLTSGTGSGTGSGTSGNSGASGLTAPAALLLLALIKLYALR